MCQYMYNKAITLIGIQGRILPIFLEVLITMTTKKKKNTHTHTQKTQITIKLQEMFG